MNSEIDDTDATPEPISGGPPTPQEQPRQQQQQQKRQQKQQQQQQQQQQQHQQRTPMSLLEQVLFEDGNQDNNDLESLPSIIPMAPPSPLSRPSPSIFSNPSPKNPPPPQPYQRNRVQQYQRQHQSGRQQYNPPPPVNEVLFNNEEDTFFEDRSLEHRTRQSLHHHTPDVTTTKLRPNRSQSVSPSTSEDDNDVLRVHGSALQALKRLKEELIQAHGKIQQYQETATFWEHRYKRLQEDNQQLSQVRLSRDVKQEQDLERSKQQLTTSRIQADDYKQQLEQLQLDYDKLKATKEQLASENTNLMVERADISTQFNEFKATKNEEVKKLKNQIEQLEAEKTELQQMNQEMTEQNKHDKEELVRRERAKLETAEATCQQLRNDLQKQQDEISSLNFKLKSYEDQKLNDIELQESHQQEMQQIKQQLEQATQEKIKALSDANQREVKQLLEALKTSNDTIQQLRSSTSGMSYSSPLSTARSNNNGHTWDTSDPYHHFDFPGSTRASTVATDATMDTSLVERLARIRDSAERANLVRSHKRDMSRLKAQHETELQQIKDQHAMQITQITKKAAIDLKTQLEQQETRLQNEFNDNIEAMKSRHSHELSQLQADFKNKEAELEDALQEALSKVATTVQQYEREVARREASIKQMRQSSEMEKRQLIQQHETDLERCRQEERSNLLSMLQKDCNQVFEKQANSPTSVIDTANSNVFRSRGGLTVDTTTSSSPKYHFNHRYRSSPQRKGGLAAATAAAARFSDRNDIDNDKPSPMYSDISSALRETEELVESLMGGNVGHY